MKIDTQGMSGPADPNYRGRPLAEQQENLPRCIPNGLEARVDYNSWPLPDIFKKIQLAGEITEEEMKRVFNLGIGFCLIVPPDVTIDTTIPHWEIGEVYEN